MGFLKERYNFPKVEWLIGAISVITVVYLTSEEIWCLVDDASFPEIDYFAMCFYISFFIISLLIIHSRDIRNSVDDARIVFIICSVCILIDLAIISFFELIALYVIQVLPQNTLGLLFVLLIGALPSSLGVVVLTSVTGKTIKNKSEALFKEAQILRKEIESSQKERKKTLDDLKSFENKLLAFEERLGKRERMCEKDGQK